MNGQNGFSAAIKTCAMECALKRIKGKCKNRFGSRVCNGCKYNIADYVDADPRHLKLFMLTAEQDAEMLHRQSNSHRPLFAAGIVICLLLALFSYNKHSDWRTKSDTYAASTVVEKVKPQPVKTDLQMIRETLALVDRDLKKRTDVNNDGLVNCIDAAVLFYQYYPDKKKCFITLNKDNPKAKDFNHLFNSVMINGVWRGVEPQSTYTGYSSFFMTDVWGSKYDSDYNKPATEIYGKYTKVK